MAKAPYPGYDPRFQNVDAIGGYNRQCLVIELLTNGKLDNVQIAQIQEQIEAILRANPNLEKSCVITQDRFDQPLRKGLRVS